MESRKACTGRPHRGAAVVLVLTALALGGCGDDGDEPEAAPTTTSQVRETTTTTEPEAELLQSGDAATNAACDLAEIEEIEAQVDAGVKEMRGLTSPGAYGETSLSCAWYLDSTDIGIPSVLVQWESPVESWHDSVIDLYRSQVEQGVSTLVEGIGEYAVIQGATAETIDGIHIVRVSVLMHAEPTPTDQANAIELLRLLLSRVKQ